MTKLADHREEIVTRYLAGESAELIAPDYDASSSAIYYHLDRAGVLRTRQQAQLLRASRTGRRANGRRLLNLELPEQIWEHIYHEAAANQETLGGAVLRLIETGMARGGGK